MVTRSVNTKQRTAKDDLLEAIKLITKIRTIGTIKNNDY